MQKDKDVNMTLSITLVITSVMMFVLLPVWIGMVIAAIACFIISPPARGYFCIIFLLLSSVFIAGIDKSGDIINYHILYSHGFDASITDEYSTEPLLLYLYRVLHFGGFSFSQALLVQVFIINFSMLFFMMRLFGARALCLFPMVVLYPQYIQLVLYLGRQSLSVIIFLWVLVAQRKNIVSGIKVFAIMGVSLLAHTSSLIYCAIYFVAPAMKVIINWKTLLFLSVVAVVFPLNINNLDFMLSALKDISPSLDRKVNYYIVAVLTQSLMPVDLYASLFWPLHAIFILLLVFFMRGGVVDERQFRWVFFFCVLYIIAIYFRDYSILSNRLTLLVNMVSPVFFLYFISELYSASRFKRLYEQLFFCFVIMTFIRFILKNDYAELNITFFGGESLLANVLSYLKLGLF